MRVGKKRPEGDIKYDGYVKIYENILTEAATSLTISGLNGDTDIEYILEIKIVNDYNGSVTYYARPNNDSTPGKYGYQFIYGNNATYSAARSTASGFVVGNCGAQNHISACVLNIHAKSGYIRTANAEITKQIIGTTVGFAEEWSQVHNDSVNNYTSLTITADQANGLGIGTEINLYKKVWKD
jgi:hypothetical protein